MGFLQDIRFGIRMMGKNPGFTLVAVLTLALGIGANSTVFTLVNAVLIKGLPFHDSQEIMSIRAARSPVSYLDYLDYRQQSRSFKGIAALSNLSADLSDQENAAERVNGASISANMFSMLGQKPLLGRDFTREDDKPGAAPVALLSNFLWQSRYGGKPDILGSAIRVNLQTYTVVGVMPQGEEFPQVTRVWLPLIQDETRQKRDQRNIQVVGRLATGVSAEQAQAELKTIAARLAQTYPDTNKDIEALVAPYADGPRGGLIRTVFLSLQGAVGFVLLIACANVANLLLSRAVGRTRETSIRTALGASRWRIVRQLLMESILMSFLGGLLGLGLSVFAIRWFDAAVADNGKPYWMVFSMDYLVFAYFLGICVLSGILFGLAPALQISKTNVNENLKEGGRGTSGGTRARRLTGALLVGEIVLTIVLLVGAGLMMRSFINMYSFDIGVETSRLLTVQVQPAAVRYPQPENRRAFQERLLERLGTLPGIDKLTIASQPPAGGALGRTLKLQDRNVADAGDRLPTVFRVAVVPGYFQALDLKVTQGRDFTAADGNPGNEVVIVNEPFVRKYFPGEDPVGKRIRLGQDFVRFTDDPNLPWLTVVGVSPPVFQTGQQNDLTVQPTVYVPFRQEPTIAFTVLARSRLPKDTLISGIRNELRSVDPDLPLYNIRTMDEILEQRRWPFRVFGTLFGAFGLIALTMSSVGIYAVTAYGVGQRTQEIGLRMALGASQRDVMWLVLRQGLRRIGVGLIFGLLAAWGLSRVLQSILVQVTAADPVTFIAITILLTLVTIIACLVPSRRAMHLDPVDALRTE
ncbi:MAG TPA: ABC transporter permease [Terriglobia bacterium]|nr:ABC transporter permease [Terriglobia bacterium]